MTQERMVLDHLLSGRSLTPLEALSLYGCFHLAGVVFNLRRAGHDILTGEATSEGRHGKKRFAVYTLNRTPHPGYGPLPSAPIAKPQEDLFHDHLGR